LRLHPIFRSLLFVIVFLLIQAASSAAVLLVFRTTGWKPGTRGVQVLLVFVLTAPLLVATTVLFLRLVDRRKGAGALAGLGVRLPAGGRRVALRQAVRVPLATLGFLGAWFALVALLPGVAVRFGGASGEIAGPSGALELAALLAGFLLQGGVEELVLRGYVYHALRERWRSGAAVLASSLLFAALHAANPDFSAAALLNTFLAGVIFAFLVERSGSLWSAVLAHGVWNFAISDLLSLPVSGVHLPHLLALSLRGPDLLTGGGFGPEGSLFLSLLALPVAFWAGHRTDAGPDRPLQEIAVSAEEDGPPLPPLETEGGPSLANDA
jgi:membrane protease YdiL (CAAX protease family)